MRFRSPLTRLDIDVFPFFFFCDTSWIHTQWLYAAADPQPFSPMQLSVEYDDQSMRWLLHAEPGQQGAYWMHVMPPDDNTFWSTQLFERQTAASVFDKVQDLRALVRSARLGAMQ